MAEKLLTTKDIPDFKKYYDADQKRNWWVLGYFGGGSVCVFDAMQIAIEYSIKNQVKLSSVIIDEIHSSARYKGFKYMFSTEKQKKDPEAREYFNVWSMLTER